MDESAAAILRMQEGMNMGFKEFTVALTKMGENINALSATVQVQNERSVGFKEIYEIQIAGLEKENASLKDQLSGTSKTIETIGKTVEEIRHKQTGMATFTEAVAALAGRMNTVENKQTAFDPVPEAINLLSLRMTAAEAKNIKFDVVPNELKLLTDRVTSIEDWRISKSGWALGITQTIRTLWTIAAAMVGAFIGHKL